jgi:hypothetical protein
MQSIQRLNHVTDLNIKPLKSLFSTFLTLYKYTIVDGDNFNCLPNVKKIDFLWEHGENDNIIFINKNADILNKYKNYAFYKNIYNYTLTNYSTKSVDDSFCIYTTNKLIQMNIPVTLYSNDMYDDVHNIINQETCFVKNNNVYSIFNSRKEINLKTFESIKPYKKLFYK